MKPNWRKLFFPSPFKIGCLVVVLAALLFAAFGRHKPTLLATLDNRITDAMFRLRGPVPTSGQVVIVDIDEKSLRALGQWPWPRDLVARLVRKITSGAPKVIGLDILFAEPDRTSPARFLASLQRYLPRTLGQEVIRQLQARQVLDHDQMLGVALAEAPSVLGYVFQTSDDGLKKEEDKPFPSATIRLRPRRYRYQDLALLTAYRAIVNLEAVAQGESEGFFNVFPDEDGTVRKVPLLMELDGLPYPSLALEMARIGLGEQTVTIHVSQKVQAARKGVLGVSLANRFIPTDDNGQLSVNFRGPTYTFPYLSAVDILNGVGIERLRGKYVLIGTSAAGLLDLRATPFANIFPGVEVQANIIDNILTGDPLAHDLYTELGLTYTLVVVGGLCLTCLLAYASPLAGGLGGILFIEATVAGNYLFFFQRNQLVGVVYPLATAVVIFMVVTLFNYFFEGREKRFISNAFSHYVSPQVVAQLLRQPERLSLAGEQKELSVLFSDIRGFTSISERLTPAELGRFMNQYLTAMSGVIMECRGTVDKYIGDAVMALWGAPLDDPAHAANSVRAAFRMRDRLKAMQREWEKRGLPTIRIGIGINSGQMSVGNFGSDQRFDYTVMGDNVNLASRLEGSNKLYGTTIIISEYTRKAIGDRFFCRFLDLVRVKGKQVPVKIYEPLCEGAPDRALREEVETFEQALAAYQGKRFDDAERILRELNDRHPSPLYRLYLERTAHCKQKPPPADWDGVFTFTSK